MGGVMCTCKGGEGPLLLGVAQSTFVGNGRNVTYKRCGNAAARVRMLQYAKKREGCMRFRRKYKKIQKKIYRLSLTHMLEQCHDNVHE